MRRPLLICTLAAALLALPSIAQAVGPGIVKGTVTPTTIAPEVEVCVVEVQPSETCTFPATDGTYTLKGAPVGNNVIEFVPSYHSHYVIQYYDHVAQQSEALSIALDSQNPQRSGINADLLLGGQLEGTLTAAMGGGPIAGLEACAFSAPEVSMGCARTDAAGHYVLPALPSDTYKVGFFGREASEYFVAQYYGGASTYAASPPISVSAGMTTSNIDAELRRGGTISGTISAATGGGRLPDISVCLFLVSAKDPKQCRFSDEAGEYSFVGLADGIYQVGFSLSPAELAGEEVSVGEEEAFLSQYYAGAASRTAATPISVVGAAVVGGVDASLRPPQAVTSVLPAALPAQIVAAAPTIAEPAPRKKAKKCKNGYRKKKLKGTLRCVRAPSHRRRHKHKRFSKG